MLDWLNTKESVRFGEELARELLKALASSSKVKDAKFTARVEKALIKADGDVRSFRERERMNFYKKSSLANAFLWTLKDGGCDASYANELTEWLTYRL